MEPEDIEQRQFGTTLRGYDRHEVEDFAKQVADHIRRLQDDLAAAEAALEAARSAPPPTPPAPAEAAVGVRHPPNADAYKQLGEQTARILISAEQAANEIKELAKREAAEVLADARRDAGRIARQAREGKQQAEADLRDVLHNRASLAGQLEDVRRRLGEAVARLQAPLEPPASPTVPDEAPDVLPSLGKASESAVSPPASDAPPDVRPSPGKARQLAASQTVPDKPPEALPSPGTAGGPDQEETRVLRGATMSRPRLRSVQQPVPRQEPRHTEESGRDRGAAASAPGSTSPGRQPQEEEKEPASASADQSGAALPVGNGKTDKPQPSGDVVELLLQEIREDSQKMVQGGLPSTTAPPSSSSTAVEPSPKHADRPQLVPTSQSPEQRESGGNGEGPVGNKTMVREAPAFERTDLQSGPSQAAELQDTGPQEEIFPQRANALGESPYEAARKLKRLLQEDHNDLLHRLRSQRGRGTLDQNMVPEQEQLDRFTGALRQILENAFAEGRKAGGAKGESMPAGSLSALVAKQVVLPLRNDLCRVVESGLSAKDTPTSISERASDVFRIWKGVRTELLGEGLVYAAFHQGLLDAYKDKAATKSWVFSEEEQECPRGVCRVNAAEGAVPVHGQFSSGHANPPAHGGCTCGLRLS